LRAQMPEPSPTRPLRFGHLSPEVPETLHISERFLETFVRSDKRKVGGQRGRGDEAIEGIGNSVPSVLSR
jgi:hypothetical protein